MVLRPARRLYRPPDGPFEMNRASPQATGLRAWWNMRPVAGNEWLEHLTGQRTAFAGTTARSIDAELGPGILVSTGSATAYTAPAWNVLYPTLTAWVRPTVVSGTRMVMSRDYGSGERTFQYRINGTKIEAIVWNSAGALVTCTSATVLSANALYLLAMTWDGVTVRHYINGVQDATTASLVGPMRTSATTQPGLGRYGGGGLDFAGQIFDLRIYEGALSPQTIWQMYDPATRWDLYQPQRRLWTVGVPAAATPPDAPTALSATATASTTIALAWTDHSADEIGFHVERSTDNVTFALIHTTLADVVAWDDTTCAPNTLYYYRVRAYNGGGESAYTSVASAKTPPANANTAYKHLVLVSGQVQQTDGRYLALVDGVPEPDTVAGVAWLWVDQTTGDLTVKFGDGHKATVAADS